MSALSIATGTLKNFQLTNSIAAGGGASILTFAIGCALVAAGVSIPYLNVPITMTMVAAAAPVVGHIVSAFVPDSVKQHLDGLAAKLQTSVENVKLQMPQATFEYPTGKNGETATVVTPVAPVAAVLVDQPADQAFPVSKNGA